MVHYFAAWHGSCKGLDDRFVVLFVRGYPCRFNSYAVAVGYFF